MCSETLICLAHLGQGVIEFLYRILHCHNCLKRPIYSKCNINCPYLENYEQVQICRQLIFGYSWVRNQKNDFLIVTTYKNE